MTRETLLHLLDVLDPEHEPGRLTLIHRFGVRDIAQRLPPLIEAVQRGARTVLWCCDPMHGNTETTASGIKTRRFDDILSELERAFDIHAAHGSYLGGVHFELTGEDVTECIGGARGLDRGRPRPRLPVPGRSAAQLRAGARDGAPGRTQDGQPGRPGRPRLTSPFRWTLRRNPPPRDLPPDRDRPVRPGSISVPPPRRSTPRCSISRRPGWASPPASRFPSRSPASRAPSTWRSTASGVEGRGVVIWSRRARPDRGRRPQRGRALLSARRRRRERSRGRRRAEAGVHSTTLGRGARRSSLRWWSVRWNRRQRRWKSRGAGVGLGLDSGRDSDS